MLSFRTIILEMPHIGFYQTKFLIPSVPSQTILRQRLIEKINQGIKRKVVLVSAPAGFGKTTLVSQWIAQADMPVAWITLDPDDNNLGRFYLLMISALQQLVFPNEAPATESEQLRDIEQVEATWINLINRIALQPQNIAIVLDDFHRIDSKPILENLCHFITYLPPRLHLFIISRTTPDISLECLRARRQVVEITLDDLRFNESEIADFYRCTCQVILNKQDIEIIHRRTEGWVTCLHLIVNSIQNRSPQEIHAFIEHLAASHRDVWDYLFEEVFYQQPAYVREFMLQTSILRNLNASLCDEVVQRSDSRMILNILERSHLLIPLDDQRRWYRYPAIMTEFLYTLLEREVGLPETFTLHRRACDWFERIGAMADAVNHAYAALDIDRSLVLLNKMRENVRVEDHFIWQFNFLKLPDEVLEQYPEVCYAGALTSMLSRDLESIQRPLEIAERAWEVDGNQEMLARVFHIKALVARYRDDIEEAILLSQKTLDNAAAEDTLTRANAKFVMGMALFQKGQAASVVPMLKEAEATIREIGDYYTADLVLASLARVFMFMGKLREAETLYLQIAASTDAKLYDQVRSAHIFLGNIYLEKDQLRLAENHLWKGIEKGDKFSTERYTGLGYAILAMVYLIDGQSARAHDLIRMGLSTALGSGRSSVIAYVKAIQARMALKQMDLDLADRWFDEIGGLPDAPPVLYNLYYYQCTTAIRLWIAHAQYRHTLDQLERASELIQSLMLNAKDEGKTKDLVELLVLEALIAALQGDTQRALQTINQAIELAQPEYYVRTFADEGALMANLLTQALQAGWHTEYVQYLLERIWRPRERAIPSTPKPGGKLLSQREIEIIKAIADGLSTREIVQTFILSPHTVRTHIKNIFEKLEVHSRVQAVEAARKRKLI